MLIRINTVLNSDKCKEHRISFVKDEPQFAPIGNEPERVTSAKLLGLTPGGGTAIYGLYRYVPL